MATTPSASRRPGRSTVRRQRSLVAHTRESSRAMCPSFRWSQAVSITVDRSTWSDTTDQMERPFTPEGEWMGVAVVLRG